MTTKHFVSLADAIKEHNKTTGKTPFNMEHLEALAVFCKAQNPKFMNDRWINYTLDNGGKKGGKV